MWVWCGHKAGCDDAGEFNGVYPHHGCQLMQLPKVPTTTRFLRSVHMCRQAGWMR